MAGEFGIQRKWRAYEDLRRRVRVLEERRKLVDNSPADPRLRLRLGDAFRAIGRLEDALGQYREAAILFERLGFRRHAHAARVLILKIRPDDSAALRDLRFASNLEQARSVTPLSRELRALPPREGYGPVLALPETIAERSPHARTEDEKAEADHAAERATPAAPVRLPEPRRVGSKEKQLKTFELLLGDDADDEKAPAMRGANGTANGRSEGVVVDVEVPEPEPPILKGRPRPKDRRGDPRVDAEGEVRIFRGADALGHLEDISESGLFISGPRYEIGTVLDVVIRTTELDWLGLARVRVARNVPATKRRGSGVGLEILWTDTPTERWIEEYVARSYGTEIALGNGNGNASEARKMLDESRRVFARKAVSLPIALVSPDFEVAGWALDLSLGGAFVNAPRVFSAGRRVEASIWLPGVPAPLRIASVVANARSSGTGIRFIRLTEQQEDLIAKTI